MPLSKHKDFVVIDFETQSEFDIRTSNAMMYSLHPSTKSLCIAYKINHSRTRLWVDGEPMPKRLKRAIKAGYLVVAHNYFFEKMMWLNVMVAKLGWVAIDDSKWVCTSAIARSKSLPKSLGACAEALKLGDQKDKTGHKMMMKLSKPRLKTKKNPNTRFWTIEENPDDYQVLYDYCIKDVDVTYAILMKLGFLSETENKYFHLDQKINSRGIGLNREQIDGAVEIAKREVNEANKQLFKLSGGAIETINQHKKIKEYINSQGVETDSTGKEAIAELLKQDKKKHNLPKNVKKILIVKSQASKTSNAKYLAMKNRIAPDDSLYGFLSYCGASRTRRWTSEGVQLQNIARGSIKKPVILDYAIKCLQEHDFDGLKLVFGTNTSEVISSCLRGAFIARKDKVFICSDYSAIEARVLNWLAGDKKFLENFYNGVDIYKLLASDIYKIPVSKIGKDSLERFVGKQGELGLGYQLSALGKTGDAGFKAGLARFGVEISETDARRIVKIYRKKHPKVVKLWYGLQEASVEAIENFSITKYGKIKFDRTTPEYLKMILPSGRSIYYWYPKIHKQVNKKTGQVNKSFTYMGVHQTTGKWVKLFNYGGKLTENASQATSRDLLANAMYEIEEYKEEDFSIVLTVHDEVLAEADDEGEVRNKKKLKIFNSLLVQLPFWAEGLPLNVEGWFGYKFKK